MHYISKLNFIKVNKSSYSDSNNKIKIGPQTLKNSCCLPKIDKSTIKRIGKNERS